MTVDTPVAPPPVQRTPRTPKSRKLNPVKVDALRKQGLTGADIAKHQGVHHTTVYRYLASTDQERREVESFKANRAEVFARLQVKSCNVQAAIMDSLLQDDGVLTALTPHQKTGMLAVLSALFGTQYDKERLERGQSTGNISIVHKLMSAAFERAGKTTTESVPTPPTTPDESCA